MDLSVVVCTKDRHFEVLEFMESLISQTRLPKELIIVDASSKSGLEEIINSRFSPPFEITYVKAKPHLPSQRVIGFEKSSGDIICYFDDDVVLEKECLDEVAKVFENDKEDVIGGVTGRQLNVNKNKRGLKHKIKFLVRYLFFMQYDNGDGKFRLSGHPKPVYTEGKNIEVEFLSGCFMCYRKSVLEHVRIDTNIEFYDEDVDLSYRVSREYKCVYAHKACLNHKATPSGRDKSYIKSRDSIRSQIYIFRKNIPKEPINVITFFLSIIGFFILRILTLDIRGFFGGIDGVLKWNLLERSVIP